MNVKHLCGHIVDAPKQYAPMIKRTFCDDCKESYKRIAAEQQRKFRELIKERLNPLN